jgi:hypothetical protein
MQQDYQVPDAEGQMRILTFPSVCTYTWQPQIDITTYELALCMPLMAVGTTPDGWTQMNWMYDHLPAEAQRHWSVDGKADARLRALEALDD